MPHVLSDKEAINGVEPAKGIKSTHAWPLFKLIKGAPFFLFSERPGLLIQQRPQIKTQETVLAFLLRWQIFNIH